MKCDIKFKYRLAESYKSLQLRVSLRFSTPRHDIYCKIWVKNYKYNDEGIMLFELLFLWIALRVLCDLCGE